MAFAPAEQSKNSLALSIAMNRCVKSEMVSDWMNALNFLLTLANISAPLQTHKSFWWCTFAVSLVYDVDYVERKENCQHIFKTINICHAIRIHWTKQPNSVLHLFLSLRVRLRHSVCRVQCWINKMKYLRFVKINSTRAHRKWYSLGIYFSPSYYSLRFLSLSLHHRRGFNFSQCVSLIGSGSKTMFNTNRRGVIAHLMFALYFSHSLLSLQNHNFAALNVRARISSLIYPSQKRILIGAH